MANTTKTTAHSGVSIYTVTQGILLALKIAGLTTISWGVVLIPTYIVLALIVVLLVIVGIAFSFE